MSVSAIVRRARDLGLVDHVIYRRANMHIRSKGWNRGKSSEPALEQPEVLLLALEVLKEAALIPQVLNNLDWMPEPLDAVSGFSHQPPERHVVVRLR